MKIKVISFNHKLNSSIEKLINHYKKQIKQLEMVEYKPISDSNKETEFILNKLNEGDFFICLSENGTAYNSVQFAEFIEKTMYTYKRIVFLIGKAEGINPQLLDKANK